MCLGPTRSVMVALVACGMNTLISAQVPTFRFTQPHGDFGVGLKVVEQYDESRTFRPAIDSNGAAFTGERGRPLQTLVWYPATPTNGETLSYADYVGLWDTETSFGSPQHVAEDRRIKPFLSTNLPSKMWAIRNASPIAGRFPVVIYSPGASHPAWDNADLCEYLASHGYVVIAVSSIGRTTRRVSVDVAGAITAARDITFLIGFAKSLPDTDASAVAVAGHSWGGLAGLFAAANDDRVRALISLDGSLRYLSGVVEEGHVHPTRIRIPLLEFEQRNFSIEDFAKYMSPTDRTAPNPLNQWTHGDLTLIHMLGLVHENFNSLSQRQANTWTRLGAGEPLYGADYGPDDAALGYGWVARYTLAFVDLHLKGRTDALAFLKSLPAANGVPAHVMAVSYRPAESKLLSFDTFREDVSREGYSKAQDVLAIYRARDAKFDVPEPDLQDWSETLIEDKRFVDAVAVSRVDTALHPESSDAFLKLGDAVLLAGNPEAAKVAYQTAIKLDPENDDAKEKLDSLNRR